MCVVCVCTFISLFVVTASKPTNQQVSDPFFCPSAAVAHSLVGNNAIVEKVLFSGDRRATGVRIQLPTGQVGCGLVSCVRACVRAVD